MLEQVSIANRVPPAPEARPSGGFGASRGAGSSLFAGLMALVGSSSSSASPSAMSAPNDPVPIDLDALQGAASARDAEPKGGEALKALVSDLLALQQQLDAGEGPDPELLGRLGEELKNVAATLDDSDRKHALLDGIGGLASLAAAIVAPGIGPVVANAAKGALEAVSGTGDAAAPPALSDLAGKLADLAGAVRPHDAELANALVDLGTRLSRGALPADALTQLGLGAGDADPALEAAIRQLTTGKGGAAEPGQPASQQAPGTAAAPATQIAAITAAGPTLAPARLQSPGSAAAKPDAAGTAAAPPPGEPADATTQAPEAKSDVRMPTAVTAPVPATAAHDGGAEPATEALDAPDATQPPVQPQSPAQAASTAQKALPPAYQAPQLNVPQLAFEIARQVRGGNSHFQIRLDPPELGRIDVHMKVDASGNVNARLTVERTETLDLLQRDQRSLERALTQAGLEGSRTNLEFSLRQNPFARQQGGGAPGWTPAIAPAAAAADPAAPPPVVLYRGTATPGGVNLFV